jgi:serine/threonine protein kinase
VTVRVLDVRDPFAATLALEEAELLASVRHPGLVEVREVGVLPDGKPFLAMESLIGETLADELRRGRPRTSERAAELGIPLASALEALHASGLVHRDVRPGNVFLARQMDGSVCPKLIGFGLHAAPRGDALAPAEEAFVAPEVRSGARETRASDVWSLAAALVASMGEDPLARPCRAPRKTTGYARDPLLLALSPFLTEDAEVRFDSARALHRMLVSWRADISESRRGRAAG